MPPPQTASVTPQSWGLSLINAMGWPNTTENLKILVAWEAAEGGAGPQFGISANTANFNPLNTTQTEPGSHSVNSVGVQSYPSWSVGMAATVTTLRNGNFAAILSMFSSGNASPATAASVIDGSRWGTTGLTAAMIAAASAVPGGVPVSTNGVAPSPNQVPNSPWVVGDPSNPDQDYWTTINQYCLDAQWYCFTDGEYLIVADGVEIMAQRPRATINRMDPHVLNPSEATWDNTAFAYSSTHTKKGHIQRRASLAKVTSPTEVTIRIICDIDEYRAGDTVYLINWGPADGVWLLGDVRRSIFTPYSDLTCVQAMQPISATSGLATAPSAVTGTAASAPGSGTVIARMLKEAQTINDSHYQYKWGGGHPACGTPSDGIGGGPPGSSGPPPGFDCSGAVGAVLGAGGLLAWGQPCPGSTGIPSELQGKGLLQPGWGNMHPAGPGNGPECTLFSSPSHIFMRLNGNFWGTADGAGHIPPASPGGGWITSGSAGSGFAINHVDPGVLGQQPAGPGSSHP